MRAMLKRTDRLLLDRNLNTFHGHLEEALEKCMYA